jgi:hypothetical protein
MPLIEDGNRLILIDTGEAAHEKHKDTAFQLSLVTVGGERST